MKELSLHETFFLNSPCTVVSYVKLHGSNSTSFSVRIGRSIE
jgi:hypothetical protein